MTPVVTQQVSIPVQIVITETTIATVGALATQTSVSTTIVSSAVATASNFAVLANANGNYASIVVDVAGTTTSLTQTSLSNAAILTLDSSCHLVEQSGGTIGALANVDGGRDPFQVYFDAASTIAANGYDYLTCSVDPATSQLVCSAGGTRNVFSIDPRQGNAVLIGSVPYTTTGGYGTTLTIVTV